MNVSYHGKKRDGVSRREEGPGARIVGEGGRWGTCHVYHGGTSICAVGQGRRHDLHWLFSVQQPVQPQKTNEPAKRCNEEKFEDGSEGRWKGSVDRIARGKGGET